MRYRVEQHRLVRHDLDRIRAWLADFSGDASARRIVAEVLGRMGALAQMPQVGTRRDEVLPDLRIVSPREAVIAFRIHEDRRVVEVLAITYGGADWQARVQARA